jgi:nuclear transcription factor Y gamma
MRDPTVFLVLFPQMHPQGNVDPLHFHPGGYTQHQYAHNQALHDQLRRFWGDMAQDVENTGSDPMEFKTQQLPLARIKKVGATGDGVGAAAAAALAALRCAATPAARPPPPSPSCCPPARPQIMKSDEDVRMISAEAPVLFAKACEFFILELTLRSWAAAEEGKRRTLQRCDAATAISRTEVFDFLVDVVPQEEGAGEPGDGGGGGGGAPAPGGAQPSGHAQPPAQQPLPMFHAPGAYLPTQAQAAMMFQPGMMPPNGMFMPPLTPAAAAAQQQQFAMMAAAAQQQHLQHQAAVAAHMQQQMGGDSKAEPK